VRVWRRPRSGRGERGGKTNVTTTTAAAATTGLRENIYNIIISLFVFFHRSGEYYLSSLCPRSLCFTQRASASECVTRVIQKIVGHQRDVFSPVCSSDDEYHGAACHVAARTPSTNGGRHASFAPLCRVVVAVYPSAQNTVITTQQ